MRSEGRETPPPVSASASAASGGLAALVLGTVLERFAPPQGLTHDLGFHGGWITALAPAFGGTRILTGSSDGTVRLRDAVSGKCERVFSSAGTTVSGIFTTPGTNRMVTAFPLGTKKVWDLETGDCLATLSDHPGDPVHCTDEHLFCRQNWNLRSLLRGKGPDSKRSEVLVYEVDTGRKVRTFPIEGCHISSLVVSPDGGKIGAAGDDRSIRIWDVATEKLLYESRRRLKWPVIVGFTPDNGSVVLSWTDTVEVRDLAGSGTSFTMAIPAEPRSYGASHALRGHRLIENRIDLSDPGPLSHTRVLDILTGRTLDEHTFPGAMELESLTGDGRFCLGFRHGWIDVWDLERHELTASLSASREYYGYAGGYNRIATVNGGIAISREESVVRLIDPASGRPARILPACEPVCDLLATPDGEGFLTMAEGKVRHWDLSSGRCVREFAIPGRELWDELPQGAPMMAITPDSRRLVLPSDDGLAVYDLPSGRRTGGCAFPGQAGPLAVYVTADGQRLIAVSGSAGFLGSCDLETGAPAAGFAPGDTGPFQAFCTDGPFIATAKGTILSLRDTRTGRLLRTWEQESYIDDILFALPQGKVVTAGYKGFYFWDREGRGTLVETDAMNVLTFGGCPNLLPGGEHFLVRGRFLIALWDMRAHRLLWRVDLAGQNKVRKLVPFPDGKRFAALDSTGVVTVRSIDAGEVLATLHVLPRGFVWETPPDDNAPSGWLWTDREDLVNISGKDGWTPAFRQGHSEHEAYLKIYNNPKMVMARIEGGDQYRRQVEFHARALGNARTGIGPGSPAALTAGRKGDRK